MILEELNIKLKESLKSRNPEVSSFLRVIKGEFDRIDKSELSENKMISVLKNLRDIALQNNNNVEVEIIDLFLPKLLTKEELEIEIDKIISDNNITSKSGLGTIMSELKSKFGSLYDGKVASNISKEKLGF